MAVIRKAKKRPQRKVARAPKATKAKPRSARAALARLRDSATLAELKLESVFETSPEPLVISRVSDGVLIAVNRAWCETTGYSREQALGRSAADLNLWDEPGDRIRLLEWLDQHGPVSGFATRFLRADGRVIDITLSSRLIELEGIACMTSAWRDVTRERQIAQRIAASEERFSKAFYASPDAIIIARLEDGRIVDANAGFTRLTGFSAEEAIGRTSLDLQLFPSAELHARMLARLREGRPIRDFDGTVRARSGEERSVRFAAEQLMLGDTDYLLAVIHDLTDERAATRAIADNERRYRALFDHALDPIAMVSPEGRILESNPAFCAALGEPCEAIVGRSVLNVFADSDAERETGRLAYLLEHGFSRGERRVRRADGSCFDVEVSAWLLPDGNIQTIARDISNRKRSEELMRLAARGVSARTGAAYFRSAVEFLCGALRAEMAFIAERVPGEDRVRTIAFWKDGALAQNFEYALAGSPCVEAFARKGPVVYAQGVAEHFPQDASLQRLGVQGYAGNSLFGVDGEPLGILVVLKRTAFERPQAIAALLELLGARSAVEIGRMHEEARLRARIAELEAILKASAPRRTAS